MVERTLKISRCQAVLAKVLENNAWSLARIARVIGVEKDYVIRVQAGHQSLLPSEIEALAKARGQQSYELILSSMNPAQLSPKQRRLFDLALREVERHREFEAVMMKKPVKQVKTRARRSTAPSVKSSTKPAARRAFARS